jgi:hypothetical protein
MGSNPIGGTRILIAPLGFARSARIAPWIAPTSSSLGDEKHVPSLLLSAARGAIRLIASLASRLIAPFVPKLVTDHMRHADAPGGSDQFWKKSIATCPDPRRTAQNITASSKPGRKAGRPSFT